MESKMAVNIIYNLHIAPIKCFSSYSKNAHNSMFSVLEDTFQLTDLFPEWSIFKVAEIQQGIKEIVNVIRPLFKTIFFKQINFISFLFSSSLNHILIPYWKLSHIGNI